MLNAETKRYIDLEIERLRRQLMAAIPEAQTFVQNAGHADEADHALTAGSANHALEADALVSGATVGYAVNAGTASEVAYDWGQGLSFNPTTKTITIDLVPGTDISIDGNTISYSGSGGGALFPDFFGTPLGTLDESDIGDNPISFNEPCFVFGYANFLGNSSGGNFTGGAVFELSRGNDTETMSICYINFGYNATGNGIVPQFFTQPVMFFLPANTGIRIIPYTSFPTPTHVTAIFYPVT